MIDRIRRLLSTPLAERERRLAFVAVAVALSVATVGLYLTRPEDRRAALAPSSKRTAQPPPVAQPPVLGAGAIPAVGGGIVSGEGPAGAMRAGRAFLWAFVHFAYGQAPARFPDAIPALRARLAAFHVAVGATQRARRLTLLAVRARPRGRTGGWEVTALASDAVNRFPVAVIVTRVHGNWTAVRLLTVAGG